MPRFICSVITILICLILKSALARPVDKKVCFKNTCIQTEVMESQVDRQQGLMHRASLAADRGMLFVFDNEDKYSFWMKGMLIPLDIIWISKDKQVAHIVEDTQPCSDNCLNLVPHQDAMYVLEVNAGFVRRHNIELGERVVF